MITSLVKDGLMECGMPSPRKSYADGITKFELTPVGNLLERDAMWCARGRAGGGVLAALPKTIINTSNMRESLGAKWISPGRKSEPKGVSVELNFEIGNTPACDFMQQQLVARMHPSNSAARTYIGVSPRQTMTIRGSVALAIVGWPIR